MFDLKLFRINYQMGVEKEQLPGLVALTPTKKAARGRENDLLVLLAVINEAAGIREDSLNSWIRKKAEIFYQTSGTVTYAIKNLVEVINSDLLARNLSRAKEGKRMSATLSLAVLRQDRLYLVNIGTAQAWHAGGGAAVHFADAEPQARGLGVNEMLTCHFGQQQVKENDVLVMSCQPPEIWNESTFTGSESLADDAVNRRLFNRLTGDLQAVMIRFVSGKGMILEQRSQYQAAYPSLVEREALDSAATNKPKSAEAVVVPPPAVSSIIPRPNDSTTAATLPARNSQEADSPAPLHVTRLPSRRRLAETKTSSPDRVDKVQEKVPLDGMKLQADKLTQQVTGGVKVASSAFSRFMHKVMPGLADEPLKFSKTALILIAIAMPLLIALIAGSIYIKAGKSRQFDQNLTMAQNYAAQAETQVNDPPLYLASLQQAMFWLEKAETYNQTDLSASLRLKLQGELDVLQGVIRLEMGEVVPGGLTAGSEITQIVATTTEVYLLDEITGTVKRYFLGSAGYEEDKDFNCGPDPKNQLNRLGKIVDMVPLNVNNQFKATLFAIDALGNTEYCVPGNVGITSALTPPDQGWKSISSIAYDAGYLYVLDINGNAVYRYGGSGVLFEEKPTLFFDNQIPSLLEAIDIEVNADELYILRNNGQMVECTYSAMKGYKLTECQDPAPYGDMRTGQSPSPISFPEANFTQMRLTSAPDSSVYLLNAATKTLYHFSLQRNLQKILHPRLMDGVNIERVTPSAFTVTSGRIAYIAFGNLIYYSPLP